MLITVIRLFLTAIGAVMAGGGALLLSYEIKANRKAAAPGDPIRVGAFVRKDIRIDWAYPGLFMIFGGCLLLAMVLFISI